MPSKGTRNGKEAEIVEKMTQSAVLPTHRLPGLLKGFQWLSGFIRIHKLIIGGGDTTGA
jgi:hypothetical protein